MVLERACQCALPSLAIMVELNNRSQKMTLGIHDALIHLMIVAASSDSAMTDRELARIQALIGRLPVFEGFDKGRLTNVANECADLLNGPGGLDHVLDAAVMALPAKLQDTAYALAVEVAAVDLHLEQEELRFLEMLRDRLALDRLTTAAIETAARARHRRLPNGQ
jgi:tellurite resistance protein